MHPRHRRLASSSRLRFALAFMMGLVFNPGARADSHVQQGLGAAAGIYAGIYVHELGHAAAFDAAGAKQIRISVPGPSCMLLCGQTDAELPHPPSAAQARLISVAGFVASNATAEGLLRHDGGARSAFGQGLIATNLYTNASHVFTYYIKIVGRDGYRGNDIDQYAMAGGNPHLLSASLLAYSVYALQRMHRKHIPLMFISTRV